MWARVIEFMLGCWLAASPFIFRHPDESVLLWGTDWIGATLVIAFALLSYWRALRGMHLLTLLVAIGLMGMGRFANTGVPPGAQNEIIVGLLLFTFAIVPNHASRPPAAWYGDAAKSALTNQSSARPA
jgi:hypothetical protein